MRTPRPGGLEVRLGTVGGAGEIVWDVDLSRLWDGVALWVALTWVEDGPYQPRRLLR